MNLRHKQFLDDTRSVQFVKKMHGEQMGASFTNLLRCNNFDSWGKIQLRCTVQVRGYRFDKSLLVIGLYWLADKLRRGVCTS